ncbi:MAG: hypothetical protein NVS1B12_14450 [Acidimicrobiales bacterium]
MPFVFSRRAAAMAAAIVAVVSTAAIPAAQARPRAAGDCHAALTRLGLQPRAGAAGTTVYSGMVASWDGVPIDTDVTVAAGSGCGLPLLSFGHGWGNAKTDWETPSDANRTDFNATSFATRGYAALTFSFRGWHGSCGPDASSTGSAAGLPAACTANGRQYWIHLSDARYEMRDAQWLIARLVDTGLADRAHLGVAGGSLGGGFAWLMAILNDRTMCGGQGWAGSPTPDPCAGKANGALVPWRTASGKRLHVAAAVPEYTWATLVNALVPNGRAGDGSSASFPASAAADRAPIGIPIQSYVTGLFADGEPLRNGFYQPATSTDRTANLPAWFSAINAMPNTINTRAPVYGGVVNGALDQLADYKSPLSPLIPVDADVPVMQIQGFTDPLFKPVEAELIRAKMKRFDPRYPLATVYGDVGHSYASNPADVWAAFNARANAFFDHVLRGRGPAPVYDESASLTRCGSDRGLRFFSAKTFGGLARATATFDGGSGTTTSGTTGQESVSTDPIVNGGCRTVASGSDPAVASWTFTPAGPQTLLGSPVVSVSVTPTGPDSEVIARLWDVSGASQTLVARGAYGRAATPGSAQKVAFQLSANGWTLPAGHAWKLELLGADAPTYQADSIPSALAITAVRLTLPTR